MTNVEVALLWFENVRGHPKQPVLETTLKFPHARLKTIEVKVIVNTRSGHSSLGFPAGVHSLSNQVVKTLPSGGSHTRGKPVKVINQSRVINEIHDSILAP